MDYEMVNLIRPDSTNWAQQKERAKTFQRTVLTLAPNPGFFGLCKTQGITGLNLLDWITKWTYDPDGQLFFNQLPTVTGAEIFMNEDQTISIISDGDEIGQLRLYDGTRRRVKDATYFNADRTIDFIEEYTFDGQLFSNLLYDKSEVQRIDFYNEAQQPVLRYFFYEKALNWITIEDPTTAVIVSQYPNMMAYLTNQLAKLLKPDDSVAITYMGMELSALALSASENTLYLQESPTDAEGQIKGNLAGILTDRIAYIQHVAVTKAAYRLLQASQLPLTKVRIENDGG